MALNILFKDAYATTLVYSLEARALRGTEAAYDRIDIGIAVLEGT